MSDEVRVLIIDDEMAIRNVVRHGLAAKDIKVKEADTGKRGLELIASFHPHLIILDLGLPDMNGLDVLKDLRTWSRVHVIVLTVTDDEQAKVRLLDAGADDYITKPFSIPELMARVRVGLRSHGRIEATPVFHSGDLEIDLNTKLVTVSGVAVKLTATEFEVIARLVRDQGRVVPQKQLLLQIWGATATDKGHFLRIYVNQLRKKIEKDPSNPTHIITEPGVGYRLV